jgi:myosin light chain 6
MSKSGFTEDQIDEFKEAFTLFDTRGDGMIPTKQVGEVLRALGQNPTEADIWRLVQDQKAEGRVTFETFLPILQAVSQKKITDTVEDFVEGLRHFDKDGNGFIGSAELRHMLTGMGEKMTDEEVEGLIQGQENTEGNINYEEFVKMVLTQ